MATELNENEILVALGSVGRSADRREMEDGVPEFDEHHDFESHLYDVVEEAAYDDGRANPAREAAVFMAALSIRYESEAGVEEVERDGFSPVSGHYTEGTGTYDVNHNPAVNIDVIDPVPLLEMGVTAGEMESFCELAVEGLDIRDMSHEDTEVTLSDALKALLTEQNIKRQNALNDGFVILPVSLAEHDITSLVKASDLRADYPLNNHAGELEVLTLMGEKAIMPVLSESMYDNMMGVKAEGHFDPFPEGVTAMAMAQFRNKVGNHVLGMNPVGAMTPLPLVPAFKGDAADWKAQHKFRLALGESVKRYQHVEGFLDHFIEQLTPEAEKHGLSVSTLLNNTAYGMSKSDRESRPELYNEIVEKAKALSVKPDDGPDAPDIERPKNT
ncbi:MAG: hypothetical protein CMJ50_00110 [Planctomycetaceae bacterium]|nr:hypothetical protein [Planctomycetaceae bacterium]